MTKFIIGDISTFPVTADPAEITGSLKVSGSSSNPRIHVHGGTGGDALSITGSVAINGNLTVEGTTSTVSTTNTLVEDKLLTLNDGGAASSGGGAGFEIEEDSAIKGYVKTSSDRAKWEFQAPSTEFVLSVEPAANNKTLSVYDDTALNQNLRTTDSPEFTALGISNSSPSSQPSEKNDLVIGDHTGNRGMTIASTATGVGTIRFAPTTAANSGEGWIDYSNNSKRMRFGTNGLNTRMSILTDGKVGIGTDTPDNQLEVLSSTAPQMRLTHTDATDYATFGVDGDGQLSITTVDGGGTGGHICLLPDGNVGIGTDAPTDFLTVAADLASGTNAGIHIAADGDDDAYLDLTEQGGSTIAAFGATDAYGFRVVYDGGAGVEALQFKSGNEAAINTRMSIKRDTGNVGIGIANPETVLHVSSSSSTEAALTVDGGVVFNRTEKDTADTAANIAYTILESDYLIGCRSESSRTVALTLPQASNCSAGQHFVIKDEGGNGGASSTQISITTQGSETLDGYAPSAGAPNNPIEFTGGYSAFTVYTDGASWFIF